LLKVLFIGNSFTARNDLPGLIARLAAARGKTLEHRLISAGGASLRTHWNAGEALKAIQSGQYDPLERRRGAEGDSERSVRTSGSWTWAYSP
jgi:hypothetical protein